MRGFMLPLLDKKKEKKKKKTIYELDHKTLSFAGMLQLIKSVIAQFFSYQIVV